MRKLIKVIVIPGIKPTKQAKWTKQWIIRVEMRESQTNILPHLKSPLTAKYLTKSTDEAQRRANYDRPTEILLSISNMVHFPTTKASTFRISQTITHSALYKMTIVTEDAFCVKV
uniref:Uncharacterized protein n=1 Tax=Glossina austeni TaxID=7395 RepID=A0A1A9UYW3_GLOAU